MKRWLSNLPWEYMLVPAALLWVCVIGALCVLTGCNASTKIVGPKAEGAVTTTTTAPDGTITTKREEVRTEGPSGQSSGTTETLDVGGANPTAAVGPIAIGTAAVKADGSGKIAGGNAARWFAGIIGVLLMLAGGVGLYLRQPIKASVGTIVIGVALLCSAIWIGLAMYLLAGVAVYAAITLWLTGFDAAGFRESLRANREGIAKLKAANPEAHDLLTDPDPRRGLIASVAEGRDLKVSKAIDKKDDLPT